MESKVVYLLIGLMVSSMHLFALSYDDAFNRYKRMMSDQQKHARLVNFMVLSFALSVALWPVVVFLYVAMAVFLSYQKIKKLVDGNRKRKTELSIRDKPYT